MSGKTDRDMDEEQLAWSAYNLGVMITMHVWGVGEEPLSEGYTARQLDVLREIAGGQLTLYSGAADLTAPYPDMDPVLRDSVHRNTNENMRREREAARLIWDLYERFRSD